jgi:perosamine synthetase
MIELSIPDLRGKEGTYLQDCLASGWISSGGRYVSLFEEKIASLIGTRFGIATINGTAALHIALLASGIKKEEEVIVPTLTFIAPVNAIAYCGAHPIFMDCDDSLNLDTVKVTEFLEKNTTIDKNGVYNRSTGRRIHAILSVHIFGNPIDMDPLREIASSLPIKIIEDATESLGSRYKGKQTGSSGTLGCFSFNGNKIITTGGGGMIVTNDEGLAGRARYLTTQAKDDDLYYVHDSIGYNYRLSSLSAAVGVAQLERLGDFIDIKRRNYHYYANALREIKGVELVPPPPDTAPNFWYYAMKVSPPYPRSRDELMIHLRERGIQTRPVWKLCHEQQPYRSMETYRIEKAPLLQKSVLNLPCSVTLSEREIDSVVEAIKS